MAKSFWMILTATVAVLGMGGDAQAQLFYRTDGTSALLTSSSWGTSSSGPFTGAWVDNSNIIFTAASAITNVTNIPVGNFTVTNSSTVTWTVAGTYNTNGAVRTFDIGTGSKLIWNGQSISGATGSGVIKNGGGTWDIGSQGNALPGGFTLNAGTVIAGGVNAIGGGVLNLNGGILTPNSGTTRSFNGSSISIGGDVQFGDSVNVPLGTGGLTFSAATSLGGANRTLNLGYNKIVTFDGIISNAGSPSTAITFGATTAGSGGSFAITNTANTFTGAIRITGGEARFTGPDSFGDVNNSIVVDGGRLASVSGGMYTLASTHNIFVGDTVGTSINVVGATGTITYNGVIADVAGKTGTWAKQGAGTLVLGGVSTYTGATAINGGTLKLTTGNDRLPTGTTVSLGQAASTNLGTLDLNGFNQTIAGLNSITGTNAAATNNTVTSTAPATLTLGGSGSYSFGDGSNANSGVIAGGISIVKNGTGTQTFGDINTYTGTTTVNAGSLLATSSGGSATGTGIVNVNSGGLLGGTGNVGGAITVAGGGTVRGDSLAGVGTLALGSHLTIASDAGNGGKIQSTVTGAPGAGNSKLSFTNGTLTLGDGTGKFTIDLKQGVVAVTEFQTYTITLATATGGGLFKLGSTTLLANDVVSQSRYAVTNNFQYGTTGNYVLAVDSTGNNLQLTFTPVPEPGAMVALGAAGLGLLGAFRRYRNRKVAVDLAA